MWRNYLVAADVARAKPMGRRERELAEIRRHVLMYFRDLCTERSTFKSMGHFHKWHWDEVQLIELCGHRPFEAEW